MIKGVSKSFIIAITCTTSNHPTGLKAQIEGVNIDNRGHTKAASQEPLREEIKELAQTQDTLYYCYAFTQCLRRMHGSV